VAYPRFTSDLLGFTEETLKMNKDSLKSIPPNGQFPGKQEKKPSATPSFR